MRRQCCLCFRLFCQGEEDTSSPGCALYLSLSFTLLLTTRYTNAHELYSRKGTVGFKQGFVRVQCDCFSSGMDSSCRRISTYSFWLCGHDCPTRPKARYADVGHATLLSLAEGSGLSRRRAWIVRLRRGIGYGRETVESIRFLCLNDPKQPGQKQERQQII